jgi:hypothetical protein
MTETTNTVGSSPDGVSDVRSTASVNAKLSHGSRTVQRCVSCLDAATVIVGQRFAYCDIHAGDELRMKLKRIQVSELSDYRDDVIDVADVVGQGTFVKYDLRYARRARMTAGTLTTIPLRFGLLRCERCDASWIGVEHELCSWCVSKAYRFSDGTR